MTEAQDYGEAAGEVFASAVKAANQQQVTGVGQAVGLAAMNSWLALQEGLFMSALSDLQAAVAGLQESDDALKQAVEDAATRVSTDLGALQAQIADLIANGATADQLQALNDQVTAIKGESDAVAGEAAAIDPAAPPAP